MAAFRALGYQCLWAWNEPGWIVLEMEVGFDSVATIIKLITAGRCFLPRLAVERTDQVCKSSGCKKEDSKRLEPDRNLIFSLHN